MLIYKILRAPEWESFETEGRFLGAPVDLADGFIHFSTAEQVAQTASRHFAGEDDLWLTAFEADTLGLALQWEPSRGGQLFPHLYRALTMDDVVWVRRLQLGSQGHQFGPLE